MDTVISALGQCLPGAAHQTIQRPATKSDISKGSCHSSKKFSLLLGFLSPEWNGKDLASLATGRK
jgi:hypothetical protein